MLIRTHTNPIRAIKQPNRLPREMSSTLNWISKKSDTLGGLTMELRVEYCSA